MAARRSPGARMAEAKTDMSATELNLPLTTRANKAFAFTKHDREAAYDYEEFKSDVKLATGKIWEARDMTAALMACTCNPRNKGKDFVFMNLPEQIRKIADQNQIPFESRVGADQNQIPFESRVAELLVKMENVSHGAKEVFLWELIRNSNTALYLHRLESVVEKTQPELFITIVADKANGSLSIIDSGIGMGMDELMERLCTIPEPLLNKFKNTIDKYLTNAADLSSFYSGGWDVGVGFYSAFMVAHKVVITTKDRGGDTQLVFESKPSEGRSFTVNSPDLCGGQRGTKVTLFLKDEHLEYLDERRLDVLVAKHTFDLCPYPIYIIVKNMTDSVTYCGNKLVLIKDRAKQLKELQQKFEGLRKLFVEVLDYRVERVVVSDRVYDLPCNLSPDRKTLEINPRSPLMERLRCDAEKNHDDESIEGWINCQYVACIANICLYDSKYGTDHLQFQLPAFLTPSMDFDATSTT